MGTGCPDAATRHGDFGRALLLARQGVALDDTVQTRGNLLATLLKSPAAIGVMRAPGDERFSSLALSPDGRTLAAGDEFGRLVFFDVRSRRPVATLDPVGETIVSLVYSRDGRELALASGPLSGVQQVSVLHMRTKVVSQVEESQGTIGLMRFLDGGRQLQIEDVGTRPPGIAGSDVRRFELPSARQLGPSVQISRGPALARTTADGRRLVVSAKDGTTIRDLTGRHVRRRFPLGFDARRYWTALSPDGRTLAAGGQDGSLRLMDLRTGRIRTASGRHGGPVGHDIEFTPDGRRLITPGDDGAVIVWDVRAAAAADTFTGHGGPVRGLAATGDGRTLYSAGADGRVFVWDLSGERRLGRPFETGPGREGEFPRYAMSSDGRLLADGRADGKVTIVDTRTLAPLRSFPVTTAGRVPRDFGVPEPKVEGIRFLPHSHLLVTGGHGGFLPSSTRTRGVC
jgi:WD40 repeat protein